MFYKKLLGWELGLPKENKKVFKSGKEIGMGKSLSEMHCGSYLCSGLSFFCYQIRHLEVVVGMVLHVPKVAM